MLLFLGDKMKLYFTEREFVSGVKVAGTAAFPQQKHSVNTQNTNTESCQKKDIAQIHSACDLTSTAQCKRGTLKVKHKTTPTPEDKAEGDKY